MININLPEKEIDFEAFFEDVKEFAEKQGYSHILFDNDYTAIELQNKILIEELHEKTKRLHEAKKLLNEIKKLVCPEK